MTVGKKFQRIREHEVGLALAVKPVDAVTGQPLRDAATVSIVGVPEEPVRNPSEYRLFLSPPVELPDDPVTVSVDAGQGYVNVPHEVHVGDLDSPGMVLPVHPAVDYPFAAYETVIEGCVECDDEPVVGATVTIKGVWDDVSNGEGGNDDENGELATTLEAIGGHPPITLTDSDGSFALLVRGIVRRDVAMNESLRFDPESGDPKIVEYYPDSTPTTPKLSVTDGNGSKTVDVEFEAGEWTELDDPIEL